MGGFTSILEWCFEHPFLMFWLITPAAIFFAYAVYKILNLAFLRIQDTELIKELVAYQALADQEGHDSEKRTTEYLSILAGYPNNTLSHVLYKYVFAHKDFSNLISYLTNQEYLKVGRATAQKRIFLSNKLAWIATALAVVGVIWGGVVEIAAATNNFRDAIVGGWLSTATMFTAIAPLVLLIFIIAVFLLIIFYSRSVVRHKAKLFKDLSESLDPFFEKVEFQEFACGVVRLVQPTKRSHRRIVKLLEEEGVAVNEGLLGECGVVLEIAPEIEAQLDEIEQAQQDEPENQESLEEIFEKFEEMPFTPPPSMSDITPPSPPPPPVQEPMAPPPPPMPPPPPPPPIMPQPIMPSSSPMFVAPPPPPLAFIPPPPPPSTFVPPGGPVSVPLVAPLHQVPGGPVGMGDSGDVTRSLNTALVKSEMDERAVFKNSTKANPDDRLVEVLMARVAPKKRTTKSKAKAKPKAVNAKEKDALVKEILMQLRGELGKATQPEPQPLPALVPLVELPVVPLPPPPKRKPVARKPAPRKKPTPKPAPRPTPKAPKEKVVGQRITARTTMSS